MRVCLPRPRGTHKLASGSGTVVVVATERGSGSAA